MKLTVRKPGTGFTVIIPDTGVSGLERPSTDIPGHVVEPEENRICREPYHKNSFYGIKRRVPKLEARKRTLAASGDFRVPAKRGWKT